MVDVRSEIFRLRQQDPPLSYAKIAAQLGVSKAKVQRELNRPAGGPPEGETSYREPVIAGDPDLVERRRAVERQRLALQEVDLQARRVEAETRLELLRNPAGNGGGNGQLAALLVSQLDRLRDDLRLAISRPHEAAPPPPSLTDQLSQWRAISETVRSFAPPTPPNSAANLEFEVMMEKVKLEDQRISRQYEEQMRAQQEQLAGQRSRDEAVARAIDQAAPLLVVAIERWLSREQKAESPPPQLPAPSADSAPAALTVLEGEVQGSCPRCGAGLAMTPGGDDDRCPGCGAEIQVANGVIGLREKGARVQALTH